MDIYKVAQFGLPGGSDIGIPSQVDTVQKIFDLSINTIMGLAGVGFLVMLILGGYQFLTASGNPQQAEKAKNTMTTATIGIVLIAAAYPIVMFITGLLGLSSGLGGGSEVATGTTPNDTNASPGLLGTFYNWATGLGNSVKGLFGR